MPSLQDSAFNEGREALVASRPSWRALRLLCPSATHSGEHVGGSEYDALRETGSERGGDGIYRGRVERDADVLDADVGA
jgi:hypothetical protein